MTHTEKQYRSEQEPYTFCDRNSLGKCVQIPIPGVLNAQRSVLPVQKNCATIAAQSMLARLPGVTYVEPVEQLFLLTHHSINTIGGIIVQQKTTNFNWNVRNVVKSALQLLCWKNTWRKSMFGFLSSVAFLAVAWTSMSSRACRSINFPVTKVLRKIMKRKVTAV